VQNTLQGYLFYRYLHHKQFLDLLGLCEFSVRFICQISHMIQPKNLLINREIVNLERFYKALRNKLIQVVGGILQFLDSSRQMGLN